MFSFLYVLLSLHELHIDFSSVKTFYLILTYIEECNYVHL